MRNRLGLTSTKSLFLLLVIIAMSSCGSKHESDPSTDPDAPPAEDTATASTDPVPAEATEEPGTLPAEPIAEASPEPSPEALSGDQLATAEPPAIDPPPAPVEEAPQASTPSRGAESYAVQPGDTLMKIAFDVYGDIHAWRKIYEANRDKIPNPNALRKGVVLNVDSALARTTPIPEGEKYRIRNGDTLGSISKDVYGTPTKWRKIYENNKELIKNPNRIYAGFYLYYTLTPEDIQQRDRYKSAPALGNTTTEPPRNPASNP